MLLAIAIASILFIFWIVKSLTRHDPLEGIPGPKGYPLLGNAPQLNPGAVVHLKLTEWAKEYGPIYKIRMMSRPVVVLTGLKEIHQMLVSKGKDFAGRRSSFRINTMMENKSDMLSTDFSPEQQFRRKILQSHLKQYGDGVKRIEDLTIATVQSMIKDCLASCGKPMDLTATIQQTIIRITYALVLGRKQDDEMEQKDISAMTDHMSDIVSASGNGIWLDIFPWLRFFGNKTYDKLQDMRSIRKRLFGGWKKTMKEENTDKDSNIIYKMMQLVENGAKFNLTETNVDVLTMILFLGATSTTVSTFSSLMNILAHHPNIQENLQQEVDKEMGRDEQIRLKDRSRLPYHYATILETLRYTSVLPLGIPHKAMQDTEICGHQIPKDCSVWANLWGLHHDEAIWSTPYEFHPERFIDESGGLVLPDHPLRQALLPFSAGPRVCLGEMFALTRMFLMLGMLMQRFNVLPESTKDKQPSHDPRHLKLGGVLYPIQFKVRLVERKE